MRVTRHNFYSLLPQITQIIQQTNFISLDLEMSGLHKGENFRNSSLDSIQKKYWKIKENIRVFLPLQLGLCCYSFKEGNPPTKIEAFPMEFFLYPYSLHHSLDKIFRIEQESLEFLMAHNFDFNKLFYEGVYYVSQEAEQKMNLSQIQRTFKSNFEKNARVIAPDMLSFRATHEPTVKAFMENTACYGQTLEISIKYMKYRVYKYLEECLLRDYHNYIEISYDSEFLKNREKMLVKKLNLGEIPFLENKEKNRENSKAMEGPFCGLRAVFDIIAKEKIPLIVHNGIYDILQIYDKMFKSPPELYVSFCKEISETFGDFYDTKFILTSSTLLSGQLLNKKSDLFSAYTSFLASSKKTNINNDFPIIEIKKFEENQEDFEIKSHDAMSDAFMTGYVFMRILSQLNILKDYHNKEIFQTRTNFFRNKIFNYGSRVPFVFENQINIQPIKKIFSLHEHKYEALDCDSVEKHLKANYGKISLFSESSVFLFYFHDISDENKFVDLLMQEKGIMIEKFNNKNLIISEKVLAQPITPAFLKEEEDDEPNIVNDNINNNSLNKSTN